MSAFSNAGVLGRGKRVGFRLIEVPLSASYFMLHRETTRLLHKLATHTTPSRNMSSAQGKVVGKLYMYKGELDPSKASTVFPL